MTFDLPNFADAAFAGQARIYSSDLAILGLTASISGVKSGCAVTPQGSPNMTLAVASGELYWLNAIVSVAAGNVTVSAAHGTLDRIDLVVASSAGAKSVVAGVPATIPVQPALPANAVALAQVYVPAADTSIGLTQIRDRRVVITVPAVSGATTIVRKTTNETLTNSTAFQDDNHLFFPMAPNTAYAFRLIVLASQTPTGGQARIDLTVPAGGEYHLGYGNVGNGQIGPMTVFCTATPPYGFAAFDGVAVTQNTAGTFRVRWAQQSASTDSLAVRENSYLEYRAL